MSPSITFAIPFFTGLRYLPLAMRSILAQQDGDWRAFVCDNASPEPGVENVVKAFGGGRIGYVRNATNLGMAGNFNHCIDLADTELVTLLHADDELVPTYAGAMRAVAARYPDAAAFFCRAEIIGHDSQPLFSLTDYVKDFITPSASEEFVLAGETGIEALLKGNFIMAPSLCFQKPVLGTRRFPEGFKFVLDQELTTELLLAGSSLVGIPESCYRYRRHDANATEQFTRTQLRFREESAYFDRMRIEARQRGWQTAERLAAAKRILKLNVAYRALKSAALLQVADARRGVKLLRELGKSPSRSS
ncbi:MAG: glycosyltransferase family 2 protein [Deltaproteobacteria bacterium]|nr:glycosyltransferase family 2 protein [Deltaproteobacteria bacterium]